MSDWVFVAGTLLIEDGLAGTPSPRSGDCAEGVVKDDGTPESGYGWAPSVVGGRYVQRFDGSDLEGVLLKTACLGWLRTQNDDSIDFTVEVYIDDGGSPADQPIASVAARANGVPQGVVAAFFEVGLLPKIEVPSGPFYIGVRWNPSVDRFFFVGADQSPTTSVVDGFFRDDSAPEWTSVSSTSDPIFNDHRAMLIRATSITAVAEIPVLNSTGAALPTLLVLSIGAWRLRLT